MGASGSVIANQCSKKNKSCKKRRKDYDICDFIAEGVSGKVYKGKNATNNELVALKFFGYCNNYDAKMDDIRKEIAAMQAVKGIDGLVQMEGFFMDTKRGLLPHKVEIQPLPVIVMEFLEGGPLFGRINYRDTISERFISDVFKKMMIALQSLHRRNFIHRDLKLDNVMFLEKSYDSPVKIIDLGNVVELKSSDAVYQSPTLVGTAGYLAPESILNKEYSKSSDIWQVGCTLYSLLSGLPPFDPNNYKQVTDFAYFPMTGPAWQNISGNVKSLVSKMLKKNPEHRMSLRDILQHPWLADEAPDIEFDRDYFTRIKHLALRNKMKSFFLESALMEGHTKRKRNLREALPILKQSSDVALLTSTQIEELDESEQVMKKVNAFHAKMKLLKNMVVNSITRNISEKKEINYETFTGMLKECQLQELCTLQIFNIFDIGNTGTIDPREFLLTMLAFRAEKPEVAGYNRRLSIEDKEGADVTVSNIEMMCNKKNSETEIELENEDEIQLFFNVFDIKETGYIDLEELKIAVNFLLYMGSDQPQLLPNVDELFSIIDVSQNGQIDYSEFKQFYRHVIASHLSLHNQ